MLLAMAVVLKTLKREAKEKPATLRAGGMMPAVYYGKKTASTPISVPLADFLKVWKKVGESSVVNLETKEGELPALIYDVDRDPLTEVFRHADFYVFEKGQKIKVKTPLEFTGVAPAVKDLGGVLVKVLHEIEIEAEPTHLPHSISVDIAVLVDFKSQILAKSISLPAGVSLITGAEEVVVSVYEPKEEVVLEVAPDISQIEVEKKGKEVKEGEEGAAPAAGAASKAGGEKAGAKPAEKKK